MRFPKDQLIPLAIAAFFFGLAIVAWTMLA